MKKKRARSKSKVRFTAPDFSKLAAELDASTFVTALDAVSRLFPEQQTRLERVVCALMRNGSWNESAAPSLVKFAREVCAEMAKPIGPNSPFMPSGEVYPDVFPTFDATHVIMTREQFVQYLARALKASGAAYWETNADDAGYIALDAATVCKHMEKLVNE